MGDEKKNPLLDIDIYKLFETDENKIDENSSIDIIRKAYRKKALELHPDKNLNNKEKAEKNFVQLNDAFKILSDKSARASYDAVRKARREKVKRDELLDDKRRKLKDQLESREKAAKEKSEEKTQKLRKNKEEERFQDEIERLRKEGSFLLEQELEFINEQIRSETKKRPSNDSEISNKNKKKNECFDKMTSVDTDVNNQYDFDEMEAAILKKLAEKSNS
jgi:curved DNA-binding protein CbpA